IRGDGLADGRAGSLKFWDPRQEEVTCVQIYLRWIRFRFGGYGCLPRMKMSAIAKQIWTPAVKN
ncbi:hypothetical protein ACTXT7_013506, partial [Hymenolepis weldensis]